GDHSYPDNRRRTLVWYSVCSRRGASEFRRAPGIGRVAEVSDTAVGAGVVHHRGTCNHDRDLLDGGDPNGQAAVLGNPRLGLGGALALVLDGILRVCNDRDSV